MYSTLSSFTLWAFVLAATFLLGAGLYEELVVVPFWAADAPRSLFEGNPLLRVQIRAGHVFWSTITPGVALLAIAALLTSFGLPPRQMLWRIGSTGLLLIVTAATLAYFRPSAINLVVHHGAGRPADMIAAAARTWSSLNWLRIAGVTVSLGMGVRALFSQ